MLLQIFDDAQIVENQLAVVTIPGNVGLVDARVLFVFLLERLSQLLPLVPPVHPFDGLLDAHGDEEADADGADVDEEVFPRVGGGVGRVDVEHGRTFLRWSRY